jgi:hypothetical protein
MKATYVESDVLERHPEPTVALSVLFLSKPVKHAYLP